jgi:hypothetical protein
VQSDEGTTAVSEASPLPLGVSQTRKCKDFLIGSRQVSHILETSNIKIMPIITAKALARLSLEIVTKED